MIGTSTRKIKEFLYIDRLGEGVGWSRPLEGETLLGIPAGWEGEGTQPYIQVIKDGKVRRSINCADVSVIDFEEE